jgi:hypothetical protein
MSENTIAFRPWMKALPKELRLPAGVFTSQEEWAWERIARGEIADMAMFDPSADRNAADWWKGKPDGGEPDPSSPQTFTDHHILSERFLRTVIFHEPYASGGERLGVRIMHAWVKEHILWSDRSTLEGLWLSSCRFECDVCVQALRVPGLLSFQGSVIKGALNADGLETGGGLFCREGFTADGDIRLLGAKIGGDADFTNAKLSKVLNADRLETGGAFFCTGSVVQGCVSMTGAKVGGELSFDKAILKANLIADRLEARGSVFLRNMSGMSDAMFIGARISGSVQLGGSIIHGNINLTNARIEDEVSLTRTWTESALELTQLPESKATWCEGAGLILRNASCGALAGSLAAFRRVREGKAERHHFPKLDLVGLHYENLGGLQAEQKDTLAGVEDVKELVALLEAGSDGATFTPGPYQQLARALRHMGHDERADEIMIAMKRHERACVSWARKPLSKFWLFLLDGFSGFGYRNHRALGLFAVVVLLSWGGGLGLSGAVFTPTSEGFDNVVRWFWFALGNATPLITLDDAHRTFLSEQFGAESNRVPLSVASAFYAAKIFGFVILSYYVASITGLANPRRE